MHQYIKEQHQMEDTVWRQVHDLIWVKYEHVLYRTKSCVIDQTKEQIREQILNRIGSIMRSHILKSIQTQVRNHGKKNE